MALVSLLRVEISIELSAKGPNLAMILKTREGCFDKKFIGNDFAFNSGDGDIWSVRKGGEFCFLGARALPALFVGLWQVDTYRIPNSHSPPTHACCVPSYGSPSSIAGSCSLCIHSAVLLTGERIEVHEGLPSNLNQLKRATGHLCSAIPVDSRIIQSRCPHFRRLIYQHFET